MEELRGRASRRLAVPVGETKERRISKTPEGDFLAG